MTTDNYSALMYASYMNKGLSPKRINYDIDLRIIACGIEIARLYIVNPTAFRLTSFIYLTLQYGYDVLKKYNHVSDWKLADFSAAETEYRLWDKSVIPACELYKSKLVRCVVALEKLCAIATTKGAFILNPNFYKTDKPT